MIRKIQSRNYGLELIHMQYYIDVSLFCIIDEAKSNHFPVAVY